MFQTRTSQSYPGSSKNVSAIKYRSFFGILLKDYQYTAVAVFFLKLCFKWFCPIHFPSVQLTGVKWNHIITPKLQVIFF